MGKRRKTGVRGKGRQRAQASTGASQPKTINPAVCAGTEPVKGVSVANMATKWPPRGTVDPREWERNGMPSVPPALVAVVSLHEPPDSDPHAPDKDVPQHASKGEGDDEKEKTEEAECTPTWRESVRAFVQRLQVRDITVVLVDSVDGGPFRNRDAQSHHDDAAAAADRSNLALTVAAMRGPRVYVSIGGTAHDHACMWRLPGRDRRRWVHRDHPDGLEAHNLYYCWLTATDPLPPHLESRAAAAMVALGTTASTPPGGDDDGDDDNDGDTCRFSTSRPLVSVFTSSYRSGDKIMRLYDSLLRQTYENWELVIVDDSGDGEETYREWLVARLTDSRVRRLRPDSRSGYIGSVKRLAAGACAGEVLVEADHDDRLMPDCIARLVDAFEAHRDCGFAFAETAEVYAADGSSHAYESRALASGLALNWRQWVPMLGRWHVATRTAPHHQGALSHLMFMPNHPRAWTADCYRLAGGHRLELSVADDYDLLVRTALVSRWVRVNDLAYIQYRNGDEGGGNQTFARNRHIQTLCAELCAYYGARLVARMTALGAQALPRLDGHTLWETGPDNPWRFGFEAVASAVPADATAHVYAMSSTDGCGALSVCADLVERLDRHRRSPELWRRTRIVVIGAHLPHKEIEAAAQTIPSSVSPGALRWWQIDASAADCVSYGRLLACDVAEIVVHDGDDPRMVAHMHATWGHVVGPS